MNVCVILLKRQHNLFFMQIQIKKSNIFLFDFNNCLLFNFLCQTVNYCKKRLVTSICLPTTFPPPFISTNFIALFPRNSCFLSIFLSQLQNMTAMFCVLLLVKLICFAPLPPSHFPVFHTFDTRASSHKTLQKENNAL